MSTPIYGVTLTQATNKDPAFVQIPSTLIAVDATGHQFLSAPATGTTETVTVTVLATATSGTATVTAGDTILGIYPSSNQDQFIYSVAVSGTTLTVTLAAAATANNVFKVALLKA